ncbi:MAG: beta-propeller domain-containing protein [Acutalibacteraceae bacterium]|nr:beta-propeller domain-containing protein [Acutalibacteraceae bacterium]
MNNNDILNELHNSSNDFTPSERLDPTAIEKSLSNVKRRSYKGIAGASASLAVICLTIIGVSTSTISQKPIDYTKNQSYSDIYKVVNSVKEANEESFVDKIWGYTITEDMVNSVAEDAVTFGLAENSSVTNSKNSSSSDYSETNVQVKGVDEADVVKTDGKYIYSVCDEDIFITQANNGNPLNISTIECDDNISNIYIYENKLVAFSSVYVDDLDTLTNCKEEIYQYGTNKPITNTYIYDLSDINNPMRICKFTQSGRYLSSRKIDNVLYFTTNYIIYDYEAINEDAPETYCPMYGTDNNMKCIDSKSIIVNKNVNNINYVTVASIDLNNPQQIADICSVLGSGSEVYSSKDNLYVASYCYSKNNRGTTQIMRFSLNNGEIEPNGSLRVDGKLLNQFSMDEYNGYFRVVTEKSDQDILSDVYYFITDTSANRETALYVFDSELNLTGKTKDVAKNERVKSVRFDGDIAYFVTFRQTDPLFTVDLSDPSSPKILSELKIPGFSEYLHVFDENLLLGFGREADSFTGTSEGLKLTMFDTSDKTDVKEIATRVFTDNRASSPAERDHKAIFVDEERGIIGIPYSSSTDYNYEINYAIFQYDKERNDFVLCQDFNLYEGERYDYRASKKYKRGLYIDDYFYIVTDDKIYTLDYSNFELKGELILNTSSDYQTDY